MYSLYSIAVLAIVVIASPWFIYQAVRYKKYVGSLGQRMGYLPVSFNIDGDSSIWIHAVSVGEVLTARPLITDLRRRYPELRMFLSTTTLAGQQLARRQVERKEKHSVDVLQPGPRDLLAAQRGRRDEDAEARIPLPQLGNERAGGQRFADRHRVDPDRVVPVQIEADRQVAHPLRQVADVLVVAERLVRKPRGQDHGQHDDQQRVKGVHQGRSYTIVCSY